MKQRLVCGAGCRALHTLKKPAHTIISSCGVGAGDGNARRPRAASVGPGGRSRNSIKHMLDKLGMELFEVRRKE